MVEHDLVVEEIHELVRSQIVQLEVEVVRVQSVSYRLILRVVELSEKGML